MLWATACAHALLRPIWPRYPAETPSDDACCPPYACRASRASRAWLRGRPAGWPRPRSLPAACTAAEAGGRARTTWALSRISATSASLLRTIMLSMNGASGDGLLRDLAQRRPLVAEDLRIAVLVGACRRREPQVLQHAREDAQRRLGARILRIDSTRSNSVSARTRSTSNSGTNTASLRRHSRRTRPAARSRGSRSPRSTGCSPRRRARSR